MARSVPLSRFTPRVGGGSAFFVRLLERHLRFETLSTQIYIALLDEGTPVWRPVSAAHLRDDIYRIMEQPSADERLEFVAGEFVRCRQQTFADGQTGLVGYEKTAA